MRPLANSSLFETMLRNLTPTLHNGSHHTTLHHTTWHYTSPHNGMVITCPSGQLRLHIISVDRDRSIHLRPLQPRRRLPLDWLWGAFGDFGAHLAFFLLHLGFLGTGDPWGAPWGAQTDFLRFVENWTPTSEQMCLFARACA